VEDPVEPRAAEEDHVGVLEHEGSRTAHRVRVLVSHHTLAHWGRENGQARAFDEGADFVLGVGVGESLACDEEG
jgi:hypothetical protein